MFRGLDVAQLNPRRRWTAVASFTVQVGVVATFLILPLLRPLPLPDAFMHPRIFVPVAQADVTATTSPPHSRAGNTAASAAVQPLNVAPDTRFHFPGPRTNTAAVDIGPPTWPVGAAGDGVANSISRVLSVRVPPPTLAKPPRVSAMMEGNLIHRVEPVYPIVAKTAGVQGVVLIKALISREGRIEQAQVVSGSPLLAPAALEAIRRWKYRPYYLNDQPIEVETEITVNFVLQR
jgi:periplasmic protein TonB